MNTKKEKVMAVPMLTIIIMDKRPMYGSLLNWGLIRRGYDLMKSYPISHESDFVRL